MFPVLWCLGPRRRRHLRVVGQQDRRQVDAQVPGRADHGRRQGRALGAAAPTCSPPCAHCLSSCCALSAFPCGPTAPPTQGPTRVAVLPSGPAHLRHHPLALLRLQGRQLRRAVAVPQGAGPARLRRRPGEQHPLRLQPSAPRDLRRARGPRCAVQPSGTHCSMSRKVQLSRTGRDRLQPYEFQISRPGQTAAWATTSACVLPPSWCPTCVLPIIVPGNHRPLQARRTAPRSL